MKTPPITHLGGRTNIALKLCEFLFKQRMPLFRYDNNGGQCRGDGFLTEFESRFVDKPQGAAILADSDEKDGWRQECGGDELECGAVLANRGESDLSRLAPDVLDCPTILTDSDPTEFGCLPCYELECHGILANRGGYESGCLEFWVDLAEEHAVGGDVGEGGWFHCGCWWGWREGGGGVWDIVV